MVNNGERYLRTNECLSAIYSGMKIKKDQKILAIGGSGDFPFMCVEKGAIVRAIDNSKFQIDIIHKRINYLISSDLKSFLGRYEFRKEDDILKYETDFEKLKKNLKNLIVVEGDIFDSGLDLSGFDSIYLSNVLTYPDWDKDGKAYDKLGCFSKRCSKGTLIYLSSRLWTLKSLNKIGLKENRYLTKKARTKEINLLWIPQVLVKN